MSNISLVILLVVGVICFFVCIVFADSDGEVFDDVPKRINHMRVKRIKREYEKGNLLPFIKAAKSRSAEDLITLYAYGAFESFPGYKDAMKDVIIWWAEKLPDFLKLRCYSTNHTMRYSPAEYALDEIPWKFLNNAKVRLSDEFLNEMFTDECAYDWVEKTIGNYEPFTQYLARFCYDNERVAKLFAEKNISLEEVK